MFAQKRKDKNALVALMEKRVVATVRLNKRNRQNALLEIKRAFFFDKIVITVNTNKENKPIKERISK